MIIALLAAVSVPRLKRSYDFLKLKSEVEQFQILCQVAQDLAILQKKTVQLQFFTTEHYYQFFIDTKPLSGRPGRTHYYSSYIDLQLSNTEILFNTDGTCTEFEAQWTAIQNTISCKTKPATGEVIIESI